jgi:hypothetical protein
MLFKSSTDEKHYHIVLTPDLSQDVAPDDQNTVIGLKNDHQHPVEWFDPETGDVILGEVMEHTHTFNVGSQLEEAPLPKVEKGGSAKEWKEETERSFKMKFKKAAKNDSKSIENGAEAFKYYHQEQWKDDLKEQLANSDRAALMVDQVGPNTDKLIGHFLQDIPDPALYPVESGDEAISDILTVVLKHIWRISGKDELAEQIFTDELVAGRGVWQPVLDFSRDIGGDIMVEYVPYKNILTGPHTKLDLSDCEDMFHVRFLSMNQGEMEFGDDFEESVGKKATIPMDILVETGYEYDTWYKTPGEQWDAPAATPVPNQLTAQEVQQSIFPVIDWYRKVYYKEYIFRGAEGIEAPIRMKSSDASQLKKAGVPAVDRISFSVEKLSFVNSEELVRMDTGFDHFPHEVVYGKKTSKGWSGKVYGAIDMQNEVNKRTSQMTDVVNRMAKYNDFFDGDTFATPEEKQRYLSTSSIPGSSFEVKDVDNIPVRSEGSKFPIEVLNLEQNAIQRMDMYFGAPLNVEESSKLGSRGLMLQERTALKINEIFFKHYENSFKSINKKLIGYIQRFYPPQKILRIIRSAPKSEEDMTYQKMQDTEIIKLLSDKKDQLTKYDLAIGVVKSSPTFKESNTDMLKEMMGQGAPIPLEYFIQQSSLPNKQGILALMQQQSASQAEAQQKMAGSEMAKTLAAKLPEGSPIVMALLQQSGYDVQALQQGIQGGNFQQRPQDGARDLPPGIAKRQ